MLQETKWIVEFAYRVGLETREEVFASLVSNYAYYDANKKYIVIDTGTYFVVHEIL